MCGEMAGDPMYILILMGLGLDSLSMNAIAIPKVKKIIRSISLSEVTEMTYKALSLSAAEEIEEYIEYKMKPRLAEFVI